MLQGGSIQLEDNAARGAHSTEQTEQSPGTVGAEVLKWLEMRAAEVAPDDPGGS